MAKQQRPAVKGAKQKVKGSAPARGAKPPATVKSKPARSAPRQAVRKATPPPKAARSKTAASTQPTAKPAPAPPPPAPRKPGFYEAVAIYERGVQALQKHDYQGAADLFRTVLDRYPEERELLERARLYLRVCERETERQPPGPKTPVERVYAATVALNTGDHATAMEYLQRALGEDPESDHAHYTMAVALGMKGRITEAVTHLSNAIGLNPENRALARHDPDLEALRAHDGFRAALDASPIRRRFKHKR